MIKKEILGPGLLIIIFIGIITLMNYLTTEKIINTYNMPLRQMVQSNERIEESSASFFLLTGSYNKQDYEKSSIKVFANDKGVYKYINIPINQLGIKIDNTIDKPYLYISYKNKRTDEVRTVEQLINGYYYIERYVVVCPEVYLPEKLLKIELE